MTLGLLLKPHANARYFHSVRDLSLAELTVMNGSIGAEHLSYRDIGGLELLCFDLEDHRLAEALPVVALHSSAQALFALEGDLLRPLRLPETWRMGDDIAAIQKYKGKTNERFTSLLINLSVFSGAFAGQCGGALRLLDPMCGRGTSLWEALRRGYHASGIETDRNDVKEANQFLEHYLQYHKRKHAFTRDSMTVRGKSGAARARCLIEGDLEYTCVHGDTRDAAAFYKKGSFEGIVCDLPYGVQHRSLSGKGRAQTDALMRDALPVWRELLRPGGAIVLSFNAHTIRLDTLRDMLSDAGYRPLTGGPYDGMRHWVEQAVDRDVAVAVRP